MSRPPHPQLAFRRLTTFSLRWKSKANRFASIGLLVVLVVLPGFAMWGAMITDRTGLDV